MKERFTRREFLALGGIEFGGSCLAAWGVTGQDKEGRKTNEQKTQNLEEKIRLVSGWVGAAFMIVPSLRILNLTLNSAIENPREIPPEDK